MPVFKIVACIILVIFFEISCKCQSSTDWTSQLQESIIHSSKLIIRDDETCHINNTDTCKKLFISQDTTILRNLIQNIRVKPQLPVMTCKCCGSFTFEFYNSDTLIASLSYHHHKALRWKDGKWNADGALTKESRNYLKQWLVTRAVLAPKDTVDE